jgi:hypothetical protein
MNFLRKAFAYHAARPAATRRGEAGDPAICGGQAGKNCQVRGAPGRARGPAMVDKLKAHTGFSAGRRIGAAFASPMPRGDLRRPGRRYEGA